MSSCHNTSKPLDLTSISTTSTISTTVAPVAKAATTTAAAAATTTTAATSFSCDKKTAKTRAKKEPKEKRPGRFRSSCPQHLKDRMERAISQRLYLVEQRQPEFVVLGSTGNVYTVTLQGNPCCNCPDWCKREDLCKHLIFVLVKVIGLSTNDPLSYQKAYLPSEVRRLLEMARSRRVGGSVLANRQVQQEFAKVKSGGGEHAADDDNNNNNHGPVQRRSLEQDSDCPICFDGMANLSETTYCRAQCGFNFHTNCIRLWCQRSAATAAAGSPATCPACRQPWLDENGTTTSGSSSGHDAASKRGVVNDEGYVNLGRLQGQSPQRDTSTYSPWRGGYNNNRKRSRRW